MLTFVILIDIFLVGFIVGNYQYFYKLEGYEPDFLFLYWSYKFIVFIESIDISMNFLKVPNGQESNPPSPVKLIWDYIGFKLI